MKVLSLILSLGAAFALLSCDNPKSYHIKATMTGFPDGTPVSLMSLQKHHSEAIKVAEVKNNLLEIDGEAEEPQLCFLQAKGMSGSVDLIVEPGDIRMEIYKDSLYKSSVAGTKNNEDMNAYKKGVSSINSEIALAKIAFEQADSISKDMAQSRYQKILETTRQRIRSYRLDFVQSHKESFVSLVVLQILLNQPDIDRVALKTHFDHLSPSLKASKYSQEYLKDLL